MQTLSVTYVAEPTLARFHRSGAFVRGVMGPLGSGKSSAMCLEILVRAAGQGPDPTGTRRTRFAVVRNTYPELRSTTVKTWLDWVPEAVCPMTWSSPITGRVRCPLEDGTRLDLELLFLALDSPEDARKLLSLELTGAWINEAREIPKAIVDGLAGRVGRFPAKRLGGPSWSGLFMDSNPPDDDHWWYRLAEEDRPAGWEFFRQPAALVREGQGYGPNPAAENISNQPLGQAYWLRQVQGKTAEWIKVYLLGEYGSVHAGRPVYPEYDDAVHAATVPLAPRRDLPLVLGWDFGLTPACVLAQAGPSGRLAVLEELVATDMGIRRFAREVVAPRLASAYGGMAVDSHADPAGASRAQTDERTCLDELARAGIPTVTARTNDFTARREAVAGFLSRPGGFVLDPGCRTLRKGFLGGYRLDRLAVAGEDRFRDAPAKNLFSHVHDALQYACLAAEERALRSARRAARRDPSRTGHRPADAVAGY